MRAAGHYMDVFTLSRSVGGGRGSTNISTPSGGFLVWVPGVLRARRGITLDYDPDLFLPITAGASQIPAPAVPNPNKETNNETTDTTESTMVAQSALI